jgi:hypothetical protein
VGGKYFAVSYLKKTEITRHLWRKSLRFRRYRMIGGYTLDGKARPTERTALAILSNHERHIDQKPPYIRLEFSVIRETTCVPCDVGDIA